MKPILVKPLTLIKHIDGIWWTSEYMHNEHLIQIKMQKSKGSKAHIWNRERTKVVKTIRYSYVPLKTLLNKVHCYINDHLDKT
jgi:hypothetical protein